MNQYSMVILNIDESRRIDSSPGDEPSQVPPYSSPSSLASRRGRRRLWTSRRNSLQWLASPGEALTTTCLHLIPLNRCFPSSNSRSGEPKELWKSCVVISHAVLIKWFQRVNSTTKSSNYCSPQLIEKAIDNFVGYLTF